MGCCCLQNPGIVEDMEDNMTDSMNLVNENKQAVMLKEQGGNEHFKKKAYQNAINCYKRALIRNPSQLVYYTNLALAFKANSQFKEGIQTIDKMTKSKFPASHNYSQLMTKGKVTKARCLNSLTKIYIVSNDYTAHASQKMLQNIQQAIRILQQAKKNSNIQVGQYLNNSMKIKLYLVKIKKKTSEVQVVEYLKRKIRESKNGLERERGWGRVSELLTSQQGLLQEIQGYYSRMHQKFIQEADQDEQYLIDPITYEKFKQPVIVPSGITYEQVTLREYFQKSQEYKDPITKQKFPAGQKVIARNHSLRNYISEMGKINEIRKQDIELLIC